jgi:hypothetical protein
VGLARIFYFCRNASGSFTDTAAGTRWKIEQQLCLFAGRTSAATMRANQLRLWFSSVAYTLLVALRQRGLKGTELAQARCDTIRLKLLKIGALVRVTVRRF